MKTTLTCIYCPIGCTLDVDIKEGKIKVKGNRCPKGCEYAKQELLEPKRVFFSLMRVKSKDYRVAAVRSVAPIPKNEIKKAIKEISKKHLNENTKVGDKIGNISGIDIIVTRI